MMKAITLFDPWATLAALNKKKNETRDWGTKHRGPIAIHAAKSKKAWHMDFSWDEPFFTALQERYEGSGFRYYPGCVLAIGNLVDCQKVRRLIEKDGKPAVAILENGKEITGNELAFGNYNPGRHIWIMDNVHQLGEPIPTKGHQQLWNWDESDNLVAIDPWVIGPTKIWTPRGVVSGQKVDPSREDAVLGLEVA